MTELVVRRLLIDLNEPFKRHWNGGDAFRTAYFNALSMSFPAGEQFFIDSVRGAVKRLPKTADAPLRHSTSIAHWVATKPGAAAGCAP